MIKVIEEFGIFKVHTIMIDENDTLICKSSLCAVSEQCRVIIRYSDCLCISIDNELKVSKLQVEYLEKVKLSLFLSLYANNRHN